MSDRTDKPSETLTSSEINGLNAMPNPEELPLVLTGTDLSRMSSRAGFSIPDDLAPAERDVEDDDDDEDEDSEGDYVAVGPEEMGDFPYLLRQPPMQRQPTKLDELHPFVQVLTASNVDDCVNVERAFPENERCSRDKFVYRLTRCPELNLGLFTIPVLEKDQPKPKPTLVGHIIATRTSAPRVTDASMKLPTNWESERSTTENGKTVGHEDYGSTIAVHSLAVLPEHQGKHVGTTLMKSYIGRIKEAAIAERIAIIAHDNLVPFYTALGFENKGPSDCKFGGGNWVDLIYDLV